MKPCSTQRRKIVWLTLNELAAAEERALRAHLENCPACRAYWKEMAALTGKLSSPPQPEKLEASERFHQRVVRAVRHESPKPVTITFKGWPFFSWRLALPVLVGLLVLLAGLWFGPWRPDTHRKSVASITAPPVIPVELQPTVFNYQMVANASLDRLDELLTTQGNRNPPSSPGSPPPSLAGAMTME